MKIVIIHYHLKTGGVTSVIRNHATALHNNGDQVLLISGQKPDTTWHVPVVTLPDIAYDSVRKRPADPETAVSKIMDAIKASRLGGCDLIHVHNPTLAKNRAFLRVLELLRDRGQRLFLQIHDFAEDGRPDVFFRQDYPADCHYGVINSRDYQIMLAAGLRPEGLHLVPNAVSPLPAPREKLFLPEPLLVYPVRAIRRKNIGEALLISAMLPARMGLAITQPPNSPMDFTFYRQWMDFADTWDLPVIFEAGTIYDFGALLANCSLVLTTSITEGFGFVYLEPWTLNKIVWGRRLEAICADFKARGIDLEHMYTTIEVPRELFDATAFGHRWREACRFAMDSFGLARPPAGWEDGFQPPWSNKRIDFGLLDEIAQQEVIVSVRRHPEARRKLLSINPFLDPEEALGLPQAKIAANRQAVTRHYVRMDVGAMLKSIYRRVMELDVTQAIDKKILLDSFMVPENFSLLKWSRPHVR